MKSKKSILESDLVKEIRKNLTNSHVIKVENGVSAGHPDLSVFRKGRIVLIEAKMIKNDKMKFQSSQFAFGHNAFKHGIGIWYVGLTQDGKVYAYYTSKTDVQKQLAKNIHEIKPTFVIEDYKNKEEWEAFERKL